METVTLVAVCFGALPFLGFLLWWWNDIWYGIRAKMLLPGGSKLPPGHMGLPILGEILEFLWYFKVLGRPDDFINSKRQRYDDSKGGEGGMYRSYLFRSPVVIASSPALCRFVFQSETNFSREWPSVDLIGHHSLSAAQGLQHRRLKSFISRGINQSDALRRIALMVQPRVIDTLRSWAEKGRICVSAEAEKVTFENIGKYMVNFEPGPLLDELSKHYEVMTEGYRATPINFPGTTYYRSLQSREKVMAIFREEYEKRIEKIRSGGIKCRETTDLLDGLMQFKDDEGKQLSDVEVIENIVNLVVGGHKSTALSIMWAVYHVAKCPHVLQKLREENIRLSQSKPAGELITSDDIMKLEYTNKVVEETIRHGNMSMVIFRTAKNDVEYKGYIIPKGWLVVLWLRYLHTNPENFDNPSSFNPDRWNEAPMPGTYHAFGGGSRLCAGNMLARLQIAIFLHYLAIGYKWELVNPNANWSYVPFQKPVDGAEIFIQRFSET